ncbi:MAG: hypothetical protein II509_03565, partial [Prevotella sp.]|nr:hypothetical protein [Prevotella sp.]
MYICKRVSEDARFLLLNLSAELRPQTRKKSIQITIGVAPIKCRLLHKLFEVVADRAESMAGLRFFVPKIALFSQIKFELSTKTITTMKKLNMTFLLTALL